MENGHGHDHDHGLWPWPWPWPLVMAMAMANGQWPWPWPRPWPIAMAVAMANGQWPWPMAMVMALRACVLHSRDSETRSCFKFVSSDAGDPHDLLYNNLISDPGRNYSLICSTLAYPRNLMISLPNYPAYPGGDLPPNTIPTQPSTACNPQPFCNPAQPHLQPQP